MQIASEVCGSSAPAVILKGRKGRWRARSSWAPSCSVVATTLRNERDGDATLLIHVNLCGGNVENKNQGRVWPEQGEVFLPTC